jgi:hypothetical protein
MCFPAQVFECDLMGSVTVRADRLVEAASDETSLTFNLTHDGDPERDQRLRAKGSRITVTSRQLSDEQALAHRTSKGEQKKVRVSLSCKFLPKRDDETNPMVIVSMEDAATGTFTMITNTERQRNTRKPRFTKALELPYWTGLEQVAKFEVHDVDGHMDDLEELGEATLLASCFVNLKDFAASKAGAMDVKLKDKQGGQTENALLTVKKLAPGDDKSVHLLTQLEVGMSFEGVPQGFAKEVVLACYAFDPNLKHFHFHSATEAQPNNGNGTFKARFNFSYSAARDGELEFRLFDRDIFERFVQAAEEELGAPGSDSASDSHSGSESGSNSDEGDEAEGDDGEGRQLDSPKAGKVTTAPAQTFHDHGSDKLFGYVALSLSSLVAASKDGGKCKAKITDNNGTHIDRKAFLTMFVEGRETGHYDSDVEESSTRLSVGVRLRNLPRLGAPPKQEPRATGDKQEREFRQTNAPRVRVLLREGGPKAPFLQISASELLWDTVDPSFRHRFELGAAEEAEVKFEVEDVGPDLIKRVVLAEACIKVGDLLAKKYTTLKLPLVGVKKRYTKLLKECGSELLVYPRVFDRFEAPVKPVKQTKKDGTVVNPNARRRRKPAAPQMIELVLGCLDLPLKYSQQSPPPTKRTLKIDEQEGEGDKDGKKRPSSSKDKKGEGNSAENKGEGDSKQDSAMDREILELEKSLQNTRSELKQALEAADSAKDLTSVRVEKRKAAALEIDVKEKERQLAALQGKASGRDGGSRRPGNSRQVAELEALIARLKGEQRQLEDDALKAKSLSESRTARTKAKAIAGELVDKEKELEGLNRDSTGRSGGSKLIDELEASIARIKVDIKRCDAETNAAKSLSDSRDSRFKSKELATELAEKEKELDRLKSDGGGQAEGKAGGNDKAIDEVKSTISRINREIKQCEEDARSEKSFAEKRVSRTRAKELQSEL